MDKLKEAQQDVEWKADLAKQMEKKLKTLKECHQTELNHLFQLLQEKDLRIQSLMQKYEPSKQGRENKINYIGEDEAPYSFKKKTPEKIPDKVLSI